MSTNPQLDLHPDAESLSAFAEHQLPDHERQPILAHLATCARCRQILFLAQDMPAQDMLEPAHQETAGPVLLPSVKKPTIDWRFAWGALAACAALVALSLFLYPHHPAAAPEQAKIVAPPQTPVNPVAAPPAEEKKPLAPSTHSSRAATTQPGARISRDSAVAPATSTHFSAQPAAQPGARQSAPQQQQAAAGSSTTLNITLAPAQATQTVEVSSANAQLQPDTPPLTQTMSAQQLLPTDQVKLQSRSIHALGAMRAAPQAAPRSAATGNGISAGQGWGVGKAAAAAAPARSAAPAAKMAPHPLTVTPEDESSARDTVHRTLPSGLTAIAAVSASHHLLALDSAGVLFISEDAGVVWEPIAQSWTGRAINITLSRPTAVLAPEVTAKSPTEASSGASAAPATPSTLPALFEIVTDKGVSWTSADGRNWQTK